MKSLCANCGGEFTPTSRTQRCCSRSCSSTLNWKSPEVKARRIDGISRYSRSSEGRAHAAQSNKERWSRPGARERQAEQNKRRAAAERSAAVDIVVTVVVCKHGHKRLKGSRLCLVCRRAQWAKYREANLERERQRFRLYQEKKGAELRAKQRAARLANLDEKRKHGRDYYAKNKEAVQRKQALYIERNPLVQRVFHARRKARLIGAAGRHTKADIAAIVKAQRHRCAYCRLAFKNKKFHVDHIIALAVGGSNDRRNLQILCPTCNCSKGAKDPIQFAQQNGKLL